LIYTDEQAEEWYKAHIMTVMHRQNTVTGKLYIEDPVIMTWQLANEPQAAFPALDENLKDPLFAWVERISAYIRSMSPKQLVNVGFESKQGEWYFKKVHNFTTVDYATTHCWVQNWGVYDMVSHTIHCTLKTRESQRQLLNFGTSTTPAKRTCRLRRALR
jgi:mannan endo-1,4-beta-mannosidase